MDTSKSNAKLCEVCSKLDIHRLTHPLYPCRESLPCSTPPVEQFGTYLVLGSVGEIKSRRSTCDVCRIVADSLDKEPADLDGECRITESAEFCNFKLPAGVEARDPSITHFHFTQASVIFDTSMADQFHGPILPWDAQTKDTYSTHCILNLQTKSKSCIELGDRTGCPITEEEVLDAIGGRYVPAQVDVQLVRAWLHRCENEHQKVCTPSFKLSSDQAAMPAFVIDVVQSCLVDTPPQCRYVALSYVWGTAPVFRHLLENTQVLRKTGSLRSLPIPATIRDSMTLVHAIGERYLWVDSLSIIQDDLKISQTEIKRMAAIYSQAILTIIAAAGDHADNGLPGIRQGSREPVQRILKLADCEILTVIDVRRTPSGIEDTVWAQRAWTFQERILSNRVLVFSDNQVYWSCRATSCSEEEALEQVRDIDRHQLPFPQRPTGNALPSESLEPWQYSEIYWDLLYAYRQRRLTYQSDLLNAFNGISEILAALQNDLFFWGLPESMFSYAITWFFTGHSERNHVEVPTFDSNGSPQMVPFPSWSWAAWSGEDVKDPLHFHAGDGYGVQPVTQFYIVDKGHQLVKIKERPLPWDAKLPWLNHSGDGARALWQKQQVHQLPSLVQHPLPRIGQLHFWTSFASVNAIRSPGWKVQGRSQRQHDFILFPPFNFAPNWQPEPGSQTVRQDFVVIAACGPGDLILLAVQWKDGVAYRTGQAKVKETEWIGIENREWRFIILG